MKLRSSEIIRIIFISIKVLVSMYLHLLNFHKLYKQLVVKTEEYIKSATIIKLKVPNFRRYKGL